MHVHICYKVKPGFLKRLANVNSCKSFTRNENEWCEIWCRIGRDITVKLKYAKVTTLHFTVNDLKIMNSDNKISKFETKKFRTAPCKGLRWKLFIKILRKNDFDIYRSKKKFS